MKLIDILVEELPKRGGWPKSAANATQDEDGEVCFSRCRLPDFGFASWNNGDWVSGAEFHTAKATDYAATIITREQYEAALAAKNEGWIEWSGGECPVEESVLVDVKFRDGSIHKAQRANYYEWGHGRPHFATTGCDIIAYRLPQPQEAEQAKADNEADLNECIGQDAAQVWSGEGQPPVGVECEYSWAGEPWASGVIRYISKHTIIIETQADSTGDTECAYHPTDIKLRPLRTEADRKRDEAIEEMIKIATMYTTKSIGLDLAFNSIYNSIAAGEIPGVKLED